MLSRKKCLLISAGIGFILAGIGLETTSPDSFASTEPQSMISGNSSALTPKHEFLSNALSSCDPIGRMIMRPPGDDLLAPTATMCIAGALAGADPTFNRPANQTTGSGVQSPCFGAAIVSYDRYTVELAGCAVFPTDVTMTLCGPAGCLPVAVTDTTLHLYRNVAAGDPLTANGGLPSPFNAASPCTNIRAANASLNGGAASTSPTGNTCNQVTAVCLGACAANTTTAGFNRRLGSGRFVLVVSGAGPADAGGYNLFIDAPAAGCTVSMVPTAANASISGRVVTADGRGIGKTTVVIAGGGIASPVTVVTNPFGYYSFSDLAVGEVYTISVSAKGISFAQPVQVISLKGNIADADFIGVN